MTNNCEVKSIIR